MVISRRHLSGFRVQGIYSLAVMRALARPLTELGRDHPPRLWSSREEAEQMAASWRDLPVTAYAEDGPRSFTARVTDPPPMELTRHGRTYYLAHFNARRASQLGRVAIGNPDAELGQSVLELLADIARIITPGQACGPAKRWRVVALGQHPGRQYRHILRQDRIKPVANRHLIGLHPPRSCRMPAAAARHEEACQPSPTAAATTIRKRLLAGYWGCQAQPHASLPSSSIVAVLSRPRFLRSAIRPPATHRGKAAPG